MKFVSNLFLSFDYFLPKSVKKLNLEIHIELLKFKQNILQIWLVIPNNRPAVSSIVNTNQILLLIIATITDERLYLMWGRTIRDLCTIMICYGIWSSYKFNVRLSNLHLTVYCNIAVVLKNEIGWNIYARSILREFYLLYK